MAADGLWARHVLLAPRSRQLTVESDYPEANEAIAAVMGRVSL